MAEAAFNENPTPSVLSPAELEYDTRTSGAPCPGETAMGMDKAASPESIAEKDTGITPGTISFTASGGAACAAFFDALQTRVARTSGCGDPSLQVHAGRMAQARMTIAQSQTCPKRRIHKAIENHAGIHVDDVIRVRPLVQCNGRTISTRDLYAPRQTRGQGHKSWGGQEMSYHYECCDTCSLCALRTSDEASRDVATRDALLVTHAVHVPVSRLCCRGRVVREIMTHSRERRVFVTLLNDETL
jgi:hypothetical protein